MFCTDLYGRQFKRNIWRILGSHALLLCLAIVTSKSVLNKWLFKCVFKEKRRLAKTRNSKFRKKLEHPSARVVYQPPGYWNFSLAIPQLWSLNCLGNQVLSPITDQKTILQKGIPWVPLALTPCSRVWPNLSLGVLSAWPGLLPALHCCWLCSSGEYQPLLTPWSCCSGLTALASTT